MATRHDFDKVFITTIVLSVVFFLFHLYFYCHSWLRSIGFTSESVDYVVRGLYRTGYFSSPYKSKGVILLLVAVASLLRTGKGRGLETKYVATAGVIGLVLYLLPPIGAHLYIMSSSIGLGVTTWAASMLGRKFFTFSERKNNLKESFPQENIKAEGEVVVNLPTRYFYHGQWHDGNIPVGNPYRGTLIVGSAGSGKSFSVFNPFIEQMIEQGSTMLLYDFKMPDLTKVVFNAFLRNIDRYKVQPHFFCINFKDLERSHRCNPIAAEYLTDIIDASETARVVMEALNKGNDKKDFFFMSAVQYVGICLWFLRIYTPPGGVMGEWCDFPHLIEMINQDYKKVLQIVRNHPSLDSKSRVFVDALEANAQDQLQGQIASARIPLNDIASPALYWVLSGDDFNLDINDPLDPKIVCVGNDPDRQQVYGAALSLIMFRAIKRVNKPGKLPCSLIFDELPTISVQGLDGLMATARSNKVATVLGVQDLSQIIADYGDKVAEKILSIPANVFVGASSIKTAEKYSKEFGKELRLQESETRGMDNHSVSRSYHDEEVMPIRKITSLPQGTFIGKVAVDKDSPIEQPFFCGSIQIDMDEYKRKQAEAQDIPALYDFGLDNLWDEISKPDVGSYYIRDEVIRQVSREWRHRRFSRRSDEELYNEANRRIASMSDEDCLQLLKSIFPRIRQSRMDGIIQENYNTIKEQIRQLIRSEFTDEDGDGGDDASVAVTEKQEMKPQNDNPAIPESEDEDKRKMPVKQLPISASAVSALLGAGIETVESLVSLSHATLMGIKGIGPTTVDIIEKQLASMGLSLSDDNKITNNTNGERN